MPNHHPIKTFIVEEHNEAFYIWKYAIAEGLLRPSGNCLLHVDEHSDMGTPRFNTSIKKLNGNMADVKAFTYKELGIADFIIPAVYLDIFNRVFWVKQQHRKKLWKAARMYERGLF